MLCPQVVASCTPTHTEITLVSDWCSSLSFWSQVPALQRTVQQVPPEEVLYDPSKTYVAVIASDGDNMQARAACLCHGYMCDGAEAVCVRADGFQCGQGAHGLARHLVRPRWVSVD